MSTHLPAIARASTTRAFPQATPSNAARLAHPVPAALTRAQSAAKRSAFQPSIATAVPSAVISAAASHRFVRPPSRLTRFAPHQR